MNVWCTTNVLEKNAAVTIYQDANNGEPFTVKTLNQSSHFGSVLSEFKILKIIERENTTVSH